MFTFLSIDAGGSRALVVAKKIQYIENKASNILGGEVKISQLVDTFTGTSVGALLASLYLQKDSNGHAKYSAEEVARLFVNHDESILQPNTWFIKNQQFNYKYPKYDNRAMQKSFENLFGNIAIKDLIKPLSICTFDILSQKPQVFNRDNASIVELAKLLLATCAAPAYFAPVPITIDGQDYLLCDGLLTHYNPTLQGLSTLFALSANATPANILTLSFGCGYSHFLQNSEQVKNWQDHHWNKMILNATTLGAVETQEEALINLYQNYPENYYRFNDDYGTKLPEFDDRSVQNFTTLNDTATAAIKEQQQQLNKVATRLAERYQHNQDGITRDYFSVLWQQKQQPLQYPPVVNQLHNLVNFIEDCTATFANRQALQSFGVSITYQQLGQYSDAVCSWLQQQGFRPKDRIAIIAPNCMSYLVVLYGILKAGCIIVNINPQYTSREMEHSLTNSQTKAVFAWEGSAKTLSQTSVSVLPTVIMTIGGMLGVKGRLVDLMVRKKGLVPDFQLSHCIAFKQVLKEGGERQRQSVYIAPNDIAFFQYTGGTTGESKAAMLSHRNILSNISQAEDFLPNDVTDAVKPLTAIAALPLYHIFALLLHGLLLLKFGVKNILITNPRDIPALVKELKQPFHILAGVNTLFVALLNNPNFAKLNFSELNLIIGGGTSMHNSVAKELENVTQCKPIQAYGLTEASPGVTAMPFDIAFNGTIGVPLLHTQVAIIDEFDNIVKQGEVGEIVVRGGQVMEGYWRGQFPTVSDYSYDSWLRTGDLGYQDADGLIYLVDRKKDLVIVSGFNVYPNEVETVISEHPEVLDCGCAGVVDRKSGQALKAYVILKPSSNLSSESLLAWCREHLTNYKIPKNIKFVEELPKSNVGKVLRRHLHLLD